MDWIEIKSWPTVVAGLGTIAAAVFLAWAGHTEIALALLGGGTLLVPNAIGKRGGS